MVLCSRCEREKYIHYLQSRNKNKKVEQKKEIWYLQWKTKKVFTMQRRDMAFTVGIMFSTEEWLGGGKVQFTFTSF